MRVLSLLSVALLVPGVLNAATFEFVEVVYNPEGTDAKREWVRVLNTGTESVDLAQWKFYENKTNHGLKAAKGSLVKPGQSAVIASDAVQFLAEHPNTEHVVFDSAFQLSNDGETLELKDPEGTVVAKVSYQGGKPKQEFVAPPVAALPAATATPSLVPWLVGVVALIMFSSFALISVRRRSRGASGYKLVAVERDSK